MGLDRLASLPQRVLLNGSIVSLHDYDLQLPRRYVQTLVELFIGNFSYSSAATPWREFADAINRVAVSDTG